MKRLGFVLVVAFLFACPRPPAAVLSSIEKPGDLEAMRDAFNADVDHRRVLVLLSPH